MKTIVGFYAVLFIITTSFAANHYVRQGATGNGSDWSNAYSNLPAVLVRGDTYYIADGSYGSYSFDDAGSALITIKKATVTDHGTETGWNDSYGDGQAAWSGFNFSRRYYEINGQTGSGKSGYGITLSNPAFDATLIRLEAAVSNITFMYVDAKAHWDPNSHDEAGKRNCIIWGGSGASNITVSHCYFHDVNWYTALQMGSWNTFLLEYSYIENVFNKEALAARDCNNAVVRHIFLTAIPGSAL
jgi:hypothetical protein